MSESKQTRRDVIDVELQKTKAELAIAKHRQAKFRNQIKGMTETERRGIKTEIGNMNREIKKNNEFIISSMENIERLTDKIAFFEKEKKSAEQKKENKAPAQKKKRTA